MVLSSATLPKLHELTDTVNDFTMKFICLPHHQLTDFESLLVGVEAH